MTNPEWVFTSIVVAPDDSRIEVTISVPQRPDKTVGDLGELTEVAQMCAVRAMGYVMKEKSK